MHAQDAEPAMWHGFSIEVQPMSVKAPIRANLKWPIQRSKPKLTELFNYLKKSIYPKDNKAKSPPGVVMG